MLILERPLEGVEPGEHVLAASSIGHKLLPLITNRVGSELAAEILRRSHVWVWPSPERDGIDKLAARLHLPEMACLAHINALRSAVCEAADKNASASAPDQQGLSVTDVTGIIDRVTEVLDQEGLIEAVANGVCEAVDLTTPLQDENFYIGVDVVPGHVAAGLTHPRPDALASIQDALKTRHLALVAGPSGSGKSALLWMTAYADRQCRWYRVRRLRDHADVVALVRLARALLPTERAPVGFVVDKVGQPGTEAWDALVEEVRGLPGAHLLGAVREEDLFLVRTLPQTKIVRLTLSEELATSIYAELHSRGHTQWVHWREPYEASEGLLLEYLHLLSEGARLVEVIGEQIRARQREDRSLELRILSVAGTATAWGAEVPLTELVRVVDASETAVSTALHRLVGEHLLQQRADGSIAGLHRLRSRGIFTAIHHRPPPTPAQSIASAIQVIHSQHLQAFLVGVLSDAPELVGDVMEAAASRLQLDLDADVAVAVLQALRLVEFRDIALRWLEALEEEAVPRAMRPLVATFVIAETDVSPMSDLLDPRVVAASERLRSVESHNGSLRLQLIAALPEGWLVRCLVAQDSCSSVARVLATLQGLGEVEQSLRTLPGLDASPLAATLAEADARDVAQVIASGRSVSIDTARRLAAATGGAETLLAAVERATPWCRGLRTGNASDGLLDGRDVDLADEALVARVEFRYVSDLAHDDVHEETVELARTIVASHPGVELVRAVALDARGLPYGFGGLEIANKWLPRQSLHTQDAVAWNRARIRTIESMLAARSQTDRIALELDLMARTADLVGALATIWLTGRGGSASALSRLDAERRRLTECVDDLPPPPTEASHHIDPLEVGGTSNRDPVQSLLRKCLVNVISGIVNTGDNPARVAALLEDVVGSLRELLLHERWRFLGFKDPPGEVAELAKTLDELNSVIAELAFGDTAMSRLQTAARAAPHRSVQLSMAARTARQLAEHRFEVACQHIRESIESLALDVEVLTRPAVQRGVIWPPIDLLMLIHLNRLDEWTRVVESLPDARSALTDTHQVWAVPIREGISVPFMAIGVYPDKVFPCPDVWDEWMPEDREALGSGACQAFREVLDRAVAVSSIAALPGGARPGPEEEVARRFASELEQGLQALLRFVEEQPDDPVLVEAGRVAEGLVRQVAKELASYEVAGQLAVAALNMLDGVQSDVTDTAAGVTVLLSEWDLAPDVARGWYAEL